MREIQERQTLQLRNAQLQQLMDSLRSVSGMWVNLLDREGRPVRTSDVHSRFCQLIRATEPGAVRCRACAVRSVMHCHETGPGLCEFSCHAGLEGCLLPILEGGAAIGYFTFGQFLPSGPRMPLWEKTMLCLDWYPGDLEELRQAFWELHQYGERDRASMTDVMRAIADYIQLRGLVHAADYTDLQRLDLYLSEHYTEKLSLQRISDDLDIGVTKLCAMAKTLSGGQTMHQLITRRRVEAAQQLLSRRNCPISDVAGMVGFPDYNYFTRVFKTSTGLTPREYRKQMESKDRESSVNVGLTRHLKDFAKK